MGMSVSSVAEFGLGAGYLRLATSAVRVNASNEHESLEGDLIVAFGESDWVGPVPSLVGRVAFERGEFAGGACRGNDGVAGSGDGGSPFSLIGACRGLGLLYCAKATLRGSLRPRRSLSTSGGLEHPDLVLRNRFIPGYAYVLSGRVAEGLPLSSGSSRPSRRAVETTTPTRLSNLSEGYLLATDRGCNPARRSAFRSQAWAARGVGLAPWARSLAWGSAGHPKG